MVLLLIVLTVDWLSGQILFSGTRTENEHSNPVPTYDDGEAEVVPGVAHHPPVQDQKDAGQRVHRQPAGQLPLVLRVHLSRGQGHGVKDTGAAPDEKCVTGWEKYSRSTIN